MMGACCRQHTCRIPSAVAQSHPCDPGRCSGASVTFRYQPTRTPKVGHLVARRSDHGYSPLAFQCGCTIGLRGWRTILIARFQLKLKGMCVTAVPPVNKPFFAMDFLDRQHGQRTPAWKFGSYSFGPQAQAKSLDSLQEQTTLQSSWPNRYFGGAGAVRQMTPCFPRARWSCSAVIWIPFCFYHLDSR